MWGCWNIGYEYKTRRIRAEFPDNEAIMHPRIRLPFQVATDNHDKFKILLWFFVKL